MEDFHVHSTFSDGSGTPEEVVQAAVRLGLTRLGFADHGYAPYDLDCCMRQEWIPLYLEQIHSLSARYAEKLEIYCGVEQDIFSPQSTEPFDYVIGSVHYLHLDGTYIPVDYREQDLLTAADRFFGGDCMCLAEEYFRTVSDVYDATRCDLIGHFDLINKLNRGNRFFDEEDPRYISAWKAAADRLLPCGVPFEINTGAMARGYRTVPYPGSAIMRYLADNGARFVLTSDSHSPDSLCFAFHEQRSAAERMGAELISFLPYD
ncbi:MAG: histidinol-phosphatase [Oscillospiraceae bacterium]|nr:histidinol-phosphatase [Oscillospiraceae bacterium]